MDKKCSKRNTVIENELKTVVTNAVKIYIIS